MTTWGSIGPKWKDAPRQHGSAYYGLDEYQNVAPMPDAQPDSAAEKVELPELDEIYKQEQAYALTLDSGAQYSIVSLKAELKCRECQFLTTLTEIQAAREEIATLTRKGEGLCAAYGNSLMEIADLREEISRLRTLCAK